MFPPFTPFFPKGFLAINLNSSASTARHAEEGGKEKREGEGQNKETQQLRNTKITHPDHSRPISFFIRQPGFILERANYKELTFYSWDLTPETIQVQHQSK